MSSVDLEKVRTIARTLALRVQHDRQFVDKILQDPEAVLAAEGLPEAYIQEFLEQTQLSDVQGYMAPACGLTVIV